MQPCLDQFIHPEYLDDISDDYTERLFSIESDAKEIIKKSAIYQIMEDVTDKCEDAANVIESIIVKYA